MFFFLFGLLLRFVVLRLLLLFEATSALYGAGTGQFVYAQRGGGSWCPGDPALCHVLRWRFWLCTNAVTARTAAGRGPIVLKQTGYAWVQAFSGWRRSLR